MDNIQRLEQLKDIYYEFDEEQKKNMAEMRKVILEHKNTMNKLIAESEKKMAKKHLGW